MRRKTASESPLFKLFRQISEICGGDEKQNNAIISRIKVFLKYKNELLKVCCIIFFCCVIYENQKRSIKMIDVCRAPIAACGASSTEAQSAEAADA